MRRITLLFLLAGCTTTVQPTGVVERLASEVVGCDLIGQVTGKPAVFGALKAVGLEGARNAAFSKAQEIGGNAVVFEPTEPGEEIVEIRGQVYRCI